MGLPTGGGFIDPNFPNPHGPHDARIVIYGYTPSYTLCILGIVLFALSFAIHTVQVLRYRSWYYLPVALACVMEVVGYIFRSFSSHKDPYSIIYFVVQYFFIIVAPVFISASIYVCLSKLMRWANDEGFDTRWLHPKLILWTFIIFDAVTTIAQIVGASLIGQAESKLKSSKVPNDIVLGGLAVQTFAFSCFLVLFGILTVALVRDRNLRPKLRSIGRFLVALEVASVLVYLRTIFRLVETSQGVFGYLMTHEAFFGGLEFTPIVLAVWILAIWHPGRWFPGNTKQNHEDGDDVEKRRRHYHHHHQSHQSGTH